MRLITTRLLIAAAFAIFVAAPPAAEALPSFAQQTGMACSACHVGAFGPQLTPFGRQELWEDTPPGRPQSEPYQWWRRNDEY